MPPGLPGPDAPEGTSTDPTEARTPKTPANDPAPPNPGETLSLEAMVYERLKVYAESLQGHFPEDMYRLIMPQLERPLIQIALELSGGEKKRAAEMLGIHRNTLRARLRELGLEEPTPPKRKRR